MAPSAVVSRPSPSCLPFFHLATAAAISRNSSECLEYASWLSCPLSLVFCTSWKGECCIAMNLTLLWKTFKTTKTLKLVNTQHRDYSWSHYIPQSATRCSEPRATPCSNCPLYEEPSGRVKTPRPCLLKHQTSIMFNIFSTSSVHEVPEMV